MKTGVIKNMCACPNSKSGIKNIMSWDSEKWALPLQNHREVAECMRDEDTVTYEYI